MYIAKIIFRLHLVIDLVVSSHARTSHSQHPLILPAIGASFSSEAEVIRILSFAKRPIHQTHSPSASTAFAVAQSSRNIHCGNNFPQARSPLYEARRIRRTNCLSRNDRMITMSKMATAAKDNDHAVAMNDNIVEQVSTILGQSIQQLEITNNGKGQESTTPIHRAVDLLRQLQHQANSFVVEESTKKGVTEDITSADLSINYPEIESGNSQCSSPSQLLAYTAICTTESLHQLVHRVNKPRKRSKKSSGHAWKALESVASSVFDARPLQATDDVNNAAAKEISHTIALLAMGLALSTNSSDETITKMVASAVIPSEKTHVLKRGKKYQKQEGSKKVASDDNDPDVDASAKRITYLMARAAVLGCLRLAIDAKQSAQGNQSEESKKQGTIDLQIVAKMEAGFRVGEFCRTLNPEKEDEELAKTVADIADCVFGKKCLSADTDGFENDTNGELICKSDIAPTLSLVANIRPWNYVKVERLVRIAAENHLFVAAEVICDAAIDTVASSKPCAQKERKSMMATSFPHGVAAESLLSDSLITSVPIDSIAHLAAGAMIDVAFDSRLYRLADVFASKYYVYGGPERYADARFLHACDTITRVVKKRQVQIIDKQVERVDEMVAKVSKDLKLTSAETKGENGPRQFHSDDIEIETMSEHIRSFTFRRLRASNMHAAAARLANLWGMEYKHDPLQMMQELKERKLTYIQWDDEGCPGNQTGDALPLPELISDPEELFHQFSLLQRNSKRTVGFDCEWHETISGVALLQLSTITHSLLLDIPALTATEEGCNALRATVGNLFSRSTEVQHVIGFGCKDDIKRLRASPCVNLAHWFPQNENVLYIKDLRNLIAEVSPQLGGTGGMQHFGLSRACEAFLGKQLDKAEQCSDWLARPLSPEQREYACLDAWSCAAIHSKILERDKNEVRPLS